MVSVIHPTADEVASTQKSQRGGKRYEIHRVGVLGSGTMGARIAAHIANAGVPVLLLDLATSEANRNAIALRAIEGLKKAKPAAFANPSAVSLLTVGNFDDDLDGLKECDWVIEAVAENLEIKRTLLAKVAPHLKGRGDSDDQHQRASGCDNRGAACQMGFVGVGLERTFSIRRATCACWS